MVNLPSGAPHVPARGSLHLLSAGLMVNHGCRLAPSFSLAVSVACPPFSRCKSLALYLSLCSGRQPGSLVERWEWQPPKTAGAGERCRVGDSRGRHLEWEGSLKATENGGLRQKPWKAGEGSIPAEARRPTAPPTPCHELGIPGRENTACKPVQQVKCKELPLTSGLGHCTAPGTAIPMNLPNAARTCGGG